MSGFDPDLVGADPYPALARLREQAPVHWSERYRSWLVTRYDDCLAAHLDPRFSSDRITPALRRAEASGASPGLVMTLRVLAGWMTFQDGREHRRLRGIVQRTFTPRAVEALHGSIRDAAGGLLDALDGRAEVDLVEDYAFPLPAIVISDLLGVSHADRDAFRAWSKDVATLLFGATDDDERHAKAEAGMGELVAYLRERIDAARRAPGDDLLSLLVATELTEDELVSMATLLLFGGHETTTNLLGSGLLALARRPEQAALVLADGADLRMAVDELLRFDGPARISTRVMAEDAELRGQQLRRGDRVHLVLAAANRDPARFEHPDEVDVLRDPNHHLGFGHGPHFCLGASLARLEAQVAIPMALRRLDGLEVEDVALRYHPTLLSRSLVALPARVAAVRAAG